MLKVSRADIENSHLAQARLFIHSDLFDSRIDARVDPFANGYEVVITMQKYEVTLWKDGLEDSVTTRSFSPNPEEHESQQLIDATIFFNGVSPLRISWDNKKVYFGYVLNGFPINLLAVDKTVAINLVSFSPRLGSDMGRHVYDRDGQWDLEVCGVTHDDADEGRGYDSCPECDRRTMLLRRFLVDRQTNRMPCACSSCMECSDWTWGEAIYVPAIILLPWILLAAVFILCGVPFLNSVI